MRVEKPALVVVLRFEMIDKFIHRMVDVNHALGLADRMADGITKHGGHYEAATLILHRFPPLVQIRLAAVGKEAMPMSMNDPPFVSTDILHLSVHTLDERLLHPIVPSPMSPVGDVLVVTHFVSQPSVHGGSARAGDVVKEYDAALEWQFRLVEGAQVR